jgi:quercetin dioxygenase-like cupin family protein
MDGGERRDGRKVVGKKSDAAVKVMAGEGVVDVTKRVLVSPAEGWDGWVMRLLEVGPHGCTPRHAHPWPHINFVASGAGELHLDGEDYEIEAGSFAFVPADVQHQYTNTGEEPLAFVCIVPEEGDY